MANHLITEDVFLRIPLNELGGTGMFGRAKLSTSRDPYLSICSSDDWRSSSWVSLNVSAEHLKVRKLTAEEHDIINLGLLPVSKFPPKLTNSSKIFAKFHVLGG
jgi:hypothetical protein